MSEPISDQAMDGVQFHNCSMAGSRFDDIDLSAAAFSDVNLRGARFTNVDLTDAVIEDAGIAGLTICGHDLAAMIGGSAGTPDRAMVAEPQLFVADIEAACGFYARLGFRIAFTHGEPPFYAQVTRGGWRLNLRQVDGPVFHPDFRASEADALSATLALEDAAPLFEEFRSAGLAFHQPLRAETWGASTFILADLDGNLIAFAGRQ